MNHKQDNFSKDEVKEILDAFLDQMLGRLEETMILAAVDKKWLKKALDNFKSKL